MACVKLVDKTRSVILSLVLGLIGALLFQWASLPLPWILGPLLFNAVPAGAGIKVWIPEWLKQPMFAVLGALFGASVSPDLAGRITQWLPSIAMILLFVTAVVALVTLYLRKVAGLDWITAYFSATPGSLLAMLALGENYGGDPRTMSLIHLVRVSMTVFSIPLAFSFFGGHENLGGLDVDHLDPDFGPFEFGILIVFCVAGYFTGRVLRFAVPQLLGPMLLIGATQIMGFDMPNFPAAIIAAAQLIIGSALGATFAGICLREVAATLGHGMGVGILMLTTAVGFALLAQHLTGLPFAALVLAFSPGGFAEMSLIGFSMGIDVTFIITHQVTRYLYVTLVAPIVVSTIRRRTGDGSP